MSAPESLEELLARVAGEHIVLLMHLRVACTCGWSSDEPMPHNRHRAHVASVQAAEVRKVMVEAAAVEGLAGE